LTTYFLTGKYEKAINKKNKLGLQGKLANAWADLLNNYWNSNKNAGNPSNVKSAVAKKVKKFSGFNQQDSNEFMTEFLSLLSEDLNKTDKKNYKEMKEKGKDESELDCAKRFWNNHLNRNDSIITDLFSGLLKSEVICSKCGFNNITFDPFNTLTLAIPPYNYMKAKKNTYRDFSLFYIPKYSIKQNCRINIHVLKDTPYKGLAEEMNKIEGFNHNLKKLIFIKVSDSKLKGFIDDNEIKSQYKEYIFSFDDERKEDEKVKVIPLYMWKGKNISAFPRLLFLKENSNFGELKKKIYYFARSYILSPLKDRKNNREEDELYNVDEEIEKYKNSNEEKEKEPYDENKLWSLFDKEYNTFFKENVDEKYKEDVDKFLEDFPYEINLKKEFDDKETISLFNGKNNLENLKEFNINNDDDSIKSLIEDEKYCLNLVLKTHSNYKVEGVNLNNCENHTSKDFGKEIRVTYTLDDLLEYFCSKENLEKGNEWKCGNCNERVEVAKKFSIFYVPRLMIICLSRFHHSGYGFSKNDELIDFPLELDMGKYISGPDKDYSKYDLFAVSQHYGGTGGGHYTAICKNYDGKWYNYNDSSVSLSSPNNVVSSAAYVLFYRRRNW
jgi:ubiquitin carboxyl-terminal hydrolase 4/11/15